MNASPIYMYILIFYFIKAKAIIADPEAFAAVFASTVVVEETEVEVVEEKKEESEEESDDDMGFGKTLIM